MSVQRAGSNNLPPPAEIAMEIIEDLEAALEQFRLLEADLAQGNERGDRLNSKATESPTTLVHLLVDFENLKPSPSDVALVRSGEYRLWVFHGPDQNKFDAALVKAWQPLGDRVVFVQSSMQRKNAVDFHIAFNLGVLHAEDRAAKRQASYVVVSGDGGFEALIEYMRTLECMVTRAGSIRAALAIQMPAARVAEPSVTPEASQPAVLRPSRGIIPATKQAPTGSTPKKKSAAVAAPTLRKSLADGDAATVTAELRKHPSNRPGDRAALEHYIVTCLRNRIAPEVAKSVIRELEQQEVVIFEGKKIVYRVPKAKK